MEPAERNPKTCLILDKTGTKQQKNRPFDRFFRVVLGGPDGVWTRGA